MSKITMIIISALFLLGGNALANDATIQQCIDNATASYDSAISSLTLQFHNTTIICTRYPAESFEYDSCYGDASDSYYTARINAKNTLDAQIAVCKI